MNKCISNKNVGKYLHVTGFRGIAQVWTRRIVQRRIEVWRNVIELSL